MPWVTLTGQTGQNVVCCWEGGGCRRSLVRKWVAKDKNLAEASTMGFAKIEHRCPIFLAAPSAISGHAPTATPTVGYREPRLSCFNPMSYHQRFISSWWYYIRVFGSIKQSVPLVVIYIVLTSGGTRGFDWGGTAGVRELL